MKNILTGKQQRSIIEEMHILRDVTAPGAEPVLSMKNRSPGAPGGMMGGVDTRAILTGTGKIRQGKMHHACTIPDTGTS